jgi:phospholipase/lecithinase/hemolysin
MDERDGFNTSRPMPRYHRLVVIGDSLSDMGNAGHFSNGPVWVEQLAARLGLLLEASSRGGTNFAIGGAQLDPASGPTALPAQAADLARRGVDPSATLYIVFGGGNDLLAAVGSENGEEMVATAVAALRSILSDLIQRGAIDILVPNLPDVGMTPAVVSYGASASRRATALSERFRRAVDGVLADLAATHSGWARLIRLDLWELAARVVADPLTSGFTNTTLPCQSLPSCEGAHTAKGTLHSVTTNRIANAVRRLRCAAYQRWSAESQELVAAVRATVRRPLPHLEGDGAHVARPINPERPIASVNCGRNIRARPVPRHGSLRGAPSDLVPKVGLPRLHPTPRAGRLAAPPIRRCPPMTGSSQRIRG